MDKDYVKAIECLLKECKFYVVYFLVINIISTSVFGDCRISTHASTRRTNLIGM